jgi:hypothetical protein
VSAAVEQHATSIGARESFYDRLLRIVGNGFADPARRGARLRLLATTLVVTAVFLAFVPNAVRQVRAANYVETAVALLTVAIWMATLLTVFGRILRRR